MSEKIEIRVGEEEEIRERVVGMLVGGCEMEEIGKKLKLGMGEVMRVVQLPVVQARVEEMRRKVYLSQRSGMVDVREIILSAAFESALVCHEVVVLGTCGGLPVPINERLRSARDMLDRAGYGAVQQSLVVTADADSMVNAYEKRKRAEGQEKVRQLTK